jgi:tRNA modification GTPase
LTASGTGAVATLAVRGPAAWSVACGLFRPRVGNVPPDPTAGWFRLGRFGAETADEVVLAVKQGGPSPWLEIHCHGGREVVRMLLETLEKRGVEVCSWQELERAAGMSPLQLAALEALTQAPTVRTAAILLDQFHGAFERALSAARYALEYGNSAEAGRIVRRLAELATLGRHLVRPWRVVLAGAPNVGKSSLANALAGYQRSIVAPTPGTTRDVVATTLAMDGWPVELSDTAGLRDEAEDLEAAGIVRAQAAVAGADLCLWVLDGAADFLPETERGSKTVLLINKIDLLPAWDHASVDAAVRVSAHTGDGVADLCQFIAARLVPQPPAPGEAVPFTSDWSDRVEAAARAVDAGRLDEALNLTTPSP